MKEKCINIFDSQCTNAVFFVLRVLGLFFLFVCPASVHAKENAAIGYDDHTYAVLPVLSALTTFLQSKMTMPDTSTTQNQVMLYGMPLFIGYISISFPTGLVLYWVVMNIMQIGQQLFMERGQKK